MSADQTIVAIAREVALRTTPAGFNDAQLGQMDAGRLIARELVDALRSGPEPADLLGSMVDVLEHGRAHVLRGFLRELQLAVAKAPA